MTQVVIYGIGSPILVDVEESLFRAGVSVIAGIRNHAGESFLSKEILVMTPDTLSEEIPDLPFVVPLFTPGNRQIAAMEAKRMGFSHPYCLIDSSVAVPRSLEMGPGGYINAGCSLGAHSHFGYFVFINRGASIGHHARFGKFVSIGPGAVVAGDACQRAAFEFRVAQVRDGKPPRGPLPVDLLVRIAALDSVPRYAVEKLREFSRVLEPTVRVDTYPASIFRSTVPAPGSLRLVAIEAMPADRLNQELSSWLRTEADREGRPHLVAMVSATLDRAWELTEEAADALFAILPIALDAERDAPRPLARLIEKGFAAAAVCDRPTAAKDLAARFLRLADGRAGWDVAEALTGQAFRALLKLGLKADADRVLHHVAERVLRGDSLARLRVSRPAEWPAALRVLLHAAAGWYYAGKGEQAHAILDEARKDLFAPETSVPNRTALALAYANTLGQAPVRVALGRLEEMFQRLKGIAVGGTTNAYYSLKPLILIETAVRAIVSDDFALGPAVRTWLDADEFAVRRRVRDDLKDAMAAQGL